MRLHLLEEIVFVVSNDLSHISSRILLYIYRILMLLMEHWKGILSVKVLGTQKEWQMGR